MLFDFDFPEEMLGGTPTGDIIAYGPFVIERQGENDLGVNLERNGDDVGYWNGGRSVEMDENFQTALVSDGTVHATAPKYQADWIFRPIEPGDASWIAPLLGGEELPSDFDAFTDTIREALDGG